MKVSEYTVSTIERLPRGYYLLIPFNVLVLEPIRILCEKIMSLDRFSYSVLPKDKEIMLTIKRIKERLANITWNIKTETKK